MPSRTRTVTITITVLLLITTCHVEAQQGHTAKDLFFTVYADGFVEVDYTVSVDPTLDRVNVTLFGDLIQDLIVEDQDGLPLDFIQHAEGVTIYTLGSTLVSMSYVTPDLTNKTAKIWTFSASTPITSSILLPANSTIVEMRSVPLSIGSLEGRALLVMPPGDLGVSYIIGVEGTRENALALIKEAELTIGTVEAKGVNVSEAEVKLQQAESAFNQGNYILSERLAAQAKASALASSAAASEAQSFIESAVASIRSAKGDGRTSGLDLAERLLQQARDLYAAGNYSASRDSALQAQEAASKATAQTSEYWFTAVFAGVSAAAILSIYLIRKKRRPERMPDAPTGIVRLDSIYENKPNLRLEDREVLRFLADRNGEAFASEIRDRFEIPRTSAWRMIRRLQKEGIVEVRNIGGQSLVRIKTRYRMPSPEK